MRDISGAEFRFAKTLTLPFFGSGIVELPPGGAKRVKNSRKMQMVFFVFYGRVVVDVGTPTTSFSIGKGGMWQVPRGKCIFFFFFFSANITMSFYKHVTKHLTGVTLYAILQCTGCRVFWNILEYLLGVFSGIFTAPSYASSVGEHLFERRTTSNL